MFAFAVVPRFRKAVKAVIGVTAHDKPVEIPEAVAAIQAYNRVVRLRLDEEAFVVGDGVEIPGVKLRKLDGVLL